MSDRPPLSAVPDPRDGLLFEWLADRETVDPRHVLNLVALQTADMRQVRPMPWDAVVDALRPAPFGRPAVRAGALIVAVALLLTAAISLVLVTGGQVPITPPVPTDNVVPNPTSNASPAASLPSAAPSVVHSPLADTPFELVILNDEGVNVIDSADGILRPIGTDLTGALVQPAWAPDGASVLIDEITPETDQIWKVPASGKGRSLVIIPCVRPCGSRNEQSYSHDGDEVVLFQATTTATCGLALYHTTTQSFDEVTSSPCGSIEERHPRFSPDDRSIAFWRSRQELRFGAIVESAIFTRDLASGEERQVTEWDAHASVLDWSPDGEWIAFVPSMWQNVAPVADLWRIRPDGTGLEQLTDVDSPSQQIMRPRYSPDGRWILFMLQSSSGSQLWAVPADGGTPIEVLPGVQVNDFDVRASDSAP